ncbi:MAG: RNase adapter RapZ, partial [Saezia sp.]
MPLDLATPSSTSDAVHDQLHLVLITGMSGAGKSIALRALEDAGYFCVDNLPAELILQLLYTIKQQKKPREYVAIA